MVSRTSKTTTTTNHFLIDENESHFRARLRPFMALIQSNEAKILSHSCTVGRIRRFLLQNTSTNQLLRTPSKNTQSGQFYSNLFDF